MSKDTNQNLAAEKSAMWKLAAYVLAVVFVSVVLLAVNAGLIFALFHGLSELLPRFPGESQVMQLIIFIAPFLLLYLEWYVWDVVTARRMKSIAGD